MKMKIVANTAMAGMIAAGSYLIPNSAMAEPQAPTPFSCPMPPHRMMMQEEFPPIPWRLGLMANKNLNENDARIITKAALLMYDRKDLDVGKITNKVSPNGRTFYVIDLVDSKGKVVSTVALDSGTGFIRPLPDGKFNPELS